MAQTWLAVTEEGMHPSVCDVVLETARDGARGMPEAGAGVVDHGGRHELLNPVVLVAAVGV